ncbi:MAG: right-handed parallel beta-helix repeat-containing protein [Armatimonadota bacterium]
METSNIAYKTIRMVRIILCSIWIITIALGARAAEMTLYVSPKGSDSNAGSISKPFKTLEKAVNAARLFRSGGNGISAPMHIVLRKGTYSLQSPVNLDAADSDLTIEGMKGEAVTLSGGRQVTGWKPYKGKIMRADISGLKLPSYEFRELYYNGVRQHIARVPNFDPNHPRTGGFAYNVDIVTQGSKSKLRYRPADMDPSKWTHTERALVDIFPSVNYGNDIRPVKSVDASNHVIEMCPDATYEIGVGDRYFIKNVFEELDASGEWYCDPDGKVLYFWPPDDKLSKSRVVVPALDRMFDIKGDFKKSNPVEGVRISGFTVQDINGTAISVVAASKCSVTACSFRNVTTAVSLGDETHDCRVAGCDITQTGGAGIVLTGTPGKHERVSRHIIDNNYIYDYGWIDRGVAGILLSSVSYCEITHNHIHDGPRWAIFSNAGNNNTFAYNHLHNVNLDTADTGVLNTVNCDGGWEKWLDVETNKKLSRGHEIHHNLVHDSGGYHLVKPGLWGFPYFSWGIYLDLSSSGYHVHDNVVYNTYYAGFVIGGGQDNFFENNVFVDGKIAQAWFCPWQKPRMWTFPMEGNRIERNIFAYDNPTAAYFTSWTFDNKFATFKDNLVFNAAGPVEVAVSDFTQGRTSWSYWTKVFGQDQGSVVADPLFVDDKNHDYSLRPDSPAFKVGFKPIDLSTAGNYESPDRYSWPRPEVKMYREEPITEVSTK